MKELGALISSKLLTFEWQDDLFKAWVVCIRTNGLTPSKLQSLKSLLHPDELEALGGNAAFVRMRDYVAGRVAARISVLASMGVDMECLTGNWPSMRILPGVFNQPVLQVEGSASRLGVSISHHDEGTVALACDRRFPMALDVERLAAEHKEAFSQVVAHDEWSGLRRSLPCFGEIDLLALVWTCKEALGKVMGCGLTVSPEFLAVTGDAYRLPYESNFGNAPGWRGTYQNCPQFNWHAWRHTDSWLTIAVPAHSRLIGISGQRCMMTGIRMHTGVFGMKGDTVSISSGWIQY